MKRFALLVALALLFFTDPGLAQLQKFRAANGGFGTAINAILPGAYHAKIFQKYGLDAEYIALESGTIAMQTLLANELQVAFTTGARGHCQSPGGRRDDYRRWYQLFPFQAYRSAGD